MLKILEFLNRLEKTKIFYKLNKIRGNSILVEIAVPGERWEVEFLENGAIEIEKFVSDGTIFEESELTKLFKNFSDE